MKFKRLVFILILFILFTSVVYTQSEYSLILTEVMFRPSESNSEFIEIYNPVLNDSVDLALIFFKYQTSSPDKFLPTTNGTILAPGQFAVIFEGDYDFDNGIYKNLTPLNAVVLKISDNAFGSSGMSNSSDRTIALIDSTGDSISVYTYSANNPAGISDEKIILTKNNDFDNWLNSKVTNGTPGSKNSVSPLDYDLALTNISVNPTQPIEGEPFEFNITVKNLGQKNSGSFSVEGFLDANFDSLKSENEKIYSTDLDSLSASDSMLVRINIDSITSGLHQFIFELNTFIDEDTSNNKIILDINISGKPNNFNDIVINEIMYRPKTGEPEWVELFNRSGQLINLKNWEISDNTSTVKISETDFELAPDEFIILSDDSTIINYYNIPSQIFVINLPSLNNNGDRIAIKDSLGTLIDSVEYFPDWGGTIGKSLERIDANKPSLDFQNWSQSISKFGATPGYINSVTQKEYDLLAKEIIFNPEFPFINDTVHISSKIINIGKKLTGFQLQLWEGDNLDSILNIKLETSPNITLAPGDSLVYKFNYFIEGITTRKGFGTKIISQEDQDTTNNQIYATIKPGFSRNSIVVNEVMFNPVNGEPEWIELYNNSNSTVNLKNWKISDVLTTPIVKTIDNNVELESNSYLVVTKSSSIFEYHRQIPSQIIELNLANLNNDEDGVVLIDDRGFTIDSMFYNSSVNSKIGYSLERLNNNVSSTDQQNWKYSTDIEQGTPGRINSVTPKSYDLVLAEISLKPNFPIPSENVKIVAKIRNTGLQNANDFSVSILYGKDYPIQLLEKHNGLDLLSKDSLIIISDNFLVIEDTLKVAVQIDFNADEDLENNYFEKKFIAGFGRKDIVVNEIMYDNVPGKSEWIEFENISDQQINLKYWSVSDLNLKKNYITDQDIVVNPTEFFIVASDTGSLQILEGIKSFEVDFGNLNNSTDGVILYDFRDAIIDSVKYKSDWGGGNGVSLERISATDESNDSTNWSSSLAPDGNTIAEPNSILYVPNYKKGDVVINEIMYNPSDENSEFIELFNSSKELIQIGGWRIKEGSGKSYFISRKYQILDKGDYYLISSDSLIFDYYNIIDSSHIITLNQLSFSLSNKGEPVSIYDIYGNLIDSVKYSPDWNNRNILDLENKSLERINPEIDSNDPQNWSTSVDLTGATPKRKNSIFTKNLNTSAKLSIQPNPFSPDNDGFEDFTIISYHLTHSVSQIRVRIFDSKGRLVRTLRNNSAVGSSGSIIFNGLDDAGRPLRIGIYIILFEASGNLSESIETLKDIVVIARKL